MRQFVYALALPRHGDVDSEQTTIYLFDLGLLRLLVGFVSFLLLFVGHGNNSEDQVDKIKGTHEDDQEEEQHMPWPHGSDNLEMGNNNNKNISRVL